MSIGVQVFNGRRFFSALPKFQINQGERAVSFENESPTETSIRTLSGQSFKVEGGVDTECVITPDLASRSSKTSLIWVEMIDLSSILDLSFR
eukprot:snap_masked-scaffold_25-processed-gene-3.24-mRNA-1 protein AED:1.00 eAED:1.00 QI:0/0/0/0/1/1/2/0/91